MRKRPPTLHTFFLLMICFLFCRAEEETSTLTNITDAYGKDYGQLINLQKLEVFFSSNTINDLRQKVMSSLGVSNLIGSGKYLGLLSIIGIKTEICFFPPKG